MDKVRERNRWSNGRHRGSVWWGKRGEGGEKSAWSCIAGGRRLHFRRVRVVENTPKKGYGDEDYNYIENRCTVVFLDHDQSVGFAERGSRMGKGDWQ